MTYRGVTFAALGVSLDNLIVKNPELPSVATVVQCKLLSASGGRDHGHVK